jgi:site-specific recombinase XerD
MIEGGAGIADVAKILGHSNLKITMRYAHPEESLKAAVELISPKNHNINHNKLREPG